MINEFGHVMKELRRSMRKIKFRVWNGVYSEFETVMSLKFEKHLFAALGDDEDKRCLDNYDTPYILEQYTGVKDKNGTEIFEGDIVRCFDNINEITDPKLADGIKPTYTQEFVWYDSGVFTKSWRGKAVHNGCGALNYSYNTMGEDLEVVGNIHENPELLTI